MIVVVDYGMGNLGSIANMFKKVGAEARIASDPEVLREADKLVIPGVGAFDNGMRSLAERGLLEVLELKGRVERVPVLGVCLGMQLLMESSEEGCLPGLGWIEGESIRFRLDDYPQLRTPHMGWNTLDAYRPHPLFAGLEDAPRFYFVHSYHVVCRREGNELARTTYGRAFTSAVVEGNVLGVQFHPEKSHRFGMQLFRNFATLEVSRADAPVAFGDEDTA
jgi:imidazole glycerol-phosphate synthase subunit HisH